MAAAEPGWNMDGMANDRSCNMAGWRPGPNLVEPLRLCRGHRNHSAPARNPNRTCLLALWAGPIAQAQTFP